MTNGPVTKARAKKIKEAMQALVHGVQNQMGRPSELQKIGNDEHKVYILIQVFEGSEVALEQ